MFRPGLTGSVAVAALVAVVLLAAPGALAKKAPPPKDRGFPLAAYLKLVAGGKLHVAGAPPKVVGAKTKNVATLKDDRYHYQPVVGLRRAGRDNGKGRFTILQAPTWGAAIAHVVGLNKELTRFLAIAFPKSIFRRKFPPLQVQIVYSFAIAPDSPSPTYVDVPVASKPHPDQKLRKRKVALVTFKRGFTPGNYLLRVRSEAKLAPHPLKRIYDLYETATETAGWLTLASKPARVAITAAGEKLVEKGIDELAGHPELADAVALTLAGSKVSKQLTRKRLKKAIKTALTTTEAFYRITVPAIVPKLVGRSAQQAITELQRRQLRYTTKRVATSNPRLLGPGRTAKVRSQSIPAGRKVKVGTRIVVTFYVPKAAAPPTSPGTVTWRLDRTEINPLSGSAPVGASVSVSNGSIAWAVQSAPQARFDLSWSPPPSSRAPGPFSFDVTVNGRITGGTSTHGLRSVSAILLVNDRWDGRSAVVARASCVDPIGAQPISCTPPSTGRGTFQVTFPAATRGATFSFGVGALNCGSCYVRYVYTAR